MRRSDDELLQDITAAITTIHSHLQHGSISVEIVMEAVAMRLLEVGEAVKSLSPEITDTEPEVKWRDISGMRDFLAHNYFTTSPEIVQAVLDKDLQPRPRRSVVCARSFSPPTNLSWVPTDPC